MHSQRNSREGDILLKILLPVVFIAAALVFTYVLILFKGEPEKKALVKILPKVEVMSIEETALSLTIESQGTVQARTVTDLMAEVSGVVEYVSPQLFAGSFFKKGEVLLEIEKVEYSAALANAKSMRATARLAYEQEKTLAEQAELDWKELGRGEPSDLVLRKPQLEKAEADIESADAGIALAERNLSKTSVRAPYDGRVQSKLVDLGQTVNARMTQLARIFTTDVAEVRLPISSKDAGYIELPESFSDGSREDVHTEVLLSSVIGDKTWTWIGSLDRVEGVVDISTRQLYLVARINDPYGQTDHPNRPPLKVGQFVSATITGKELGQGVIIPRYALKPNDVVWIIDEENRLQITAVNVAKAGVNDVYITAGLRNGDRLCLTQMGIVVDGMEVEVETPPANYKAGSER